MSDPYLGEIRLFAGQFTPRQWVFCQGQDLTISQYAELYSLLKETYGTSSLGVSFKLPDLRGRVPLHREVTTPASTLYALGIAGGDATVTLTTAQIPAHTHTLSASSNAPSVASPNGAVLANTGAAGTPYNSYRTPSGSPVALSSVAILTAGGGQSHDNLMPSLGLNFIIAVRGIYPAE